MVVTVNNFIADVFSFLKGRLETITDPLSGSRTTSKFVLTSYPQSKVEYPLITIKMINRRAERAGMQTTAMDVNLTIEVRVWARNQKEKDDLYTDVYNVLKDAQFTATTGSTANNLHDFTELSATEVDEEGQGTPKSRVGTFSYNFFNVV